MTVSLDPQSQEPSLLPRFARAEHQSAFSELVIRINHFQCDFIDEKGDKNKDEPPSQGTVVVMYVHGVRQSTSSVDVQTISREFTIIFRIIDPSAGVHCTHDDHFSLRHTYSIQLLLC